MGQSTKSSVYLKTRDCRSCVVCAPLTIARSVSSFHVVCAPSSVPKNLVNSPVLRCSAVATCARRARRGE